MDFDGTSSNGGEVGGEVSEVETRDSDYGDGDGVNDFDATYNEMNSGNETLDYDDGTDGDGTASETGEDEFDTTNDVVEDVLDGFDEPSDVEVAREKQTEQDTADDAEQSSDRNTDESVDEVLAGFEDDGEAESEDAEDTEKTDEEDGEAVDDTPEDAEEIEEDADEPAEDDAEETEEDDSEEETEKVEEESEDVEETADKSEDTEDTEEKPEEAEGTEKNAVFENVSYHQGQNDFGARGTCGPTSIANSLNRVTGTSDYTENAVLHDAMDNDLCSKSLDPNRMGGTTTENVVSIIDNVKSPESNIHTEVYEYEKALSVDELADMIDNPGTVAMVGVDSATLWDQRGDVVSTGLFQHTEAPSDHWITVDSPLRDSDGNVTGFNIIDSGGGVDYVDRDKFEVMYQGDANHTISDPTAVIISNRGEATNTYATSEGVERNENYKGSATETDGGDPPGRNK